jgi:hypothetical protein
MQLGDEPSYLMTDRFSLEESRPQQVSSIALQAELASHVTNCARAQRSSIVRETCISMGGVTIGSRPCDYYERQPKACLPAGAPKPGDPRGDVLPCPPYQQT